MKHATALRAHRLVAAGVFAWLAGVPGIASALVERLDDSSSPSSQVRASLDDGSPITAPSASYSPIVRVAFGRVHYRLATARYVGRQARIYYVLPMGIPGLRSPAGLQVSWRTNGLFASGSGRPGDRVPVWSGTVRDAWITESLDLTWQLDTRELRLTRGMPLGFEAYFEIETLP
ncbi:hypothetical protein [Variovorax sp. EL159]|uniref:hypothetical protein n=1 Tax=Variovorax sp. EL159 TaxID=1566270 RepID=UPI00088064CA|nr:hypothetical protein [Variovorax sp. EL159]SCX72096.1 hypothetical protein SAMN03159363_4136 [Variovorax sp. EL159]